MNSYSFLRGKLFLFTVIFNSILLTAQHNGHNHNHGVDFESSKDDFNSLIENPVDFSSSEPAGRFIENIGQWNSNILYRTDLVGGYIYFEKSGMKYHFYDQKGIYDKLHSNQKTFQVDNHVVEVDFLNANQNPNIFSNVILDQPILSYHYGHGSFTGVNMYGDINYNNIYNNIDLIYKSYNDHLKYDFIVHAGGNTSDIQFKYEGAEAIYVHSNGALVIETSLGGLVEYAPYAYQNINGKDVEVPCNFSVNNGIVEFNFPNGYDNTKQLVIDPSLVASTYTGSTSDNWGFTAGHLANGDMIVAGITNGGGYPTTAGAFQTTYNGGTNSAAGGMASDISISVFSGNGQNLLASTYLGGSDDETPHSLVANQSNDEIYILGKTLSNDFPTTAGAYDVTANGAEDIFVARLNSSLTTLLSSTYVGGSGIDGANFDSDFNTTGVTKFSYGDGHRGQLVLDNASNVYVASSTRSNNFPTVNAYDATYNGVCDAVVFKMNPTLTSMTFSTFLGGTIADAAFGLTLDASNNIYVTGATFSNNATNNFPTTPGTIDPTFNSNNAADGFVSLLSASGNTLLASTFLASATAGDNDGGFYVDTDINGDVYVFGLSFNGNYPVTGGVYSNAGSSQFVHSLSPNLDTTRFSTVIGAGTNVPNINPTGFRVDSCRKIILGGWGRTFNGGTNTGMPTTPGAYQTTTDGGDFYFMVLDPDATALRYATFFGLNGVNDHVDGGSSTFDEKGIVYQAVCAGCGGNNGFPTTPGAYSSTNGSTNCNNAVFKFDLDIFSPGAAAIGAVGGGCVGFPVNFTNNSTNSTSYLWDFGDGSPTDTAANPTHTYGSTGSFTVTLVAFNSTTCIPTDTATLVITIGQPTVSVSVNPVGGVICNGDTATMTASGASTYTWTPGPFTGNPYVVTPSSTTTYQVIGADGNGCTDTVQTTITVNPDCDGDGVPDSQEVIDGTDPRDPCDFVTASITLTPSAAWNALDCDGDGVTNGTEITDGTDPQDPCDYNAASITLTPSAAWNALDCDGDGVTNGQEVIDGTDPQDPCDYNAASITLTPSAAWNALDCDGDGVTNGTEITDGTDPQDPCDFVTSSITLTPSAAWNALDCDGDGVTNGQEVTDGTDPQDPCDFVTASITLTPSAAWNALDCDGDGVTNGTEITDGTDPQDPCDYNAASITLTPSAAWNALDCDGDGVTNGTEITDGTDPQDPCDYNASSITLTPSAAWNALDCDGDGVTNGTEITDGTNPQDPCDFVTASITLTPSAAWNALDCDGDGVTNGTEITDGTDPQDPCDYNAASITLTPSAAWNALDCDGDGVPNGQEVIDGTDPQDPCDYVASSQSLPTGPVWDAADCDGDGVTNGQEITDGTDPDDPCDYNAASITLTPSAAWNALDCDGDGVTNGQEVTDGTDPQDPCDFVTASITLTPSSAWNALDCDGDGVTNGQELTDGTDPQDPCDYNASSQTLTPTPAWDALDCDGDGVTNGQEVEVIDGTDPQDNCDFNPGSITLPVTSLPDCDGDGVPNAQEIIDGTDPNDPCDYNPASQTQTPNTAWNLLDCDGDGVTNGQEVMDGTDPQDPCDYMASSQTLPTGPAWDAADCDGDGVPNGQEVMDGTDPQDPCDFVTASITLTPSAAWDALDCDGDGVPNGQEEMDGTDPQDPCDYMASSQSLPTGPVWDAADCDGDGVANGQEVIDGTDPQDPCDYVASSQTLPTGPVWDAADCDGDGVPNGQEVMDGTDPNDPCDYNTANQTLPTGPVWDVADCDGDGVPNGQEVIDGTDPQDPCDYNPTNQTMPTSPAWDVLDCDGDGVPNGQEVSDGTNPMDPCDLNTGNVTLPTGGQWDAADCDGDGVPNGQEVSDGTNPYDPCDVNEASVSLPVTSAPCELHIPEGFSPNGDGVNDLFVIRGIENYPDNTFSTFNRWGNKVFEAAPYKNDWGGINQFGVTIGGDELPVGTYFYILDLGDGSEPITGYIYLNR